MKLLPWELLILLSLRACLAGSVAWFRAPSGAGVLGAETPRHGPVFTQEPSDSLLPLVAHDNQAFINCKAKGNPPPRYQWRVDGREVNPDLDPRYSLVQGNLLIRDPLPAQHGGVYQCTAANAFGAVVSREARLQFAFLQNFSRKSRNTVSVREGQAVVLLCGPPPHSGEIRFSWAFNGRPGLVRPDGRRFVSQRTGNLYVATVEPADAGNYTCVVRSTVSNNTAFSSPTPVVLRTDAVMGEYEPKMEVQFPETLRVPKGSSVKLECFALGNPVPSISWRRADGAPLAGKVQVHGSGGVLEVPYFRPEDQGVYECAAENRRGRTVARGRLLFHDVEHLQWVQTLKDANIAIEANLRWECQASGKPAPAYRWLRNGQPLAAGERTAVEAGTLVISGVTLADSGMYQCVAANEHAAIYASAELKVVASPPNFSWSPVKKSTLVQRGGEVVLGCRPRAAPRALISWRRGGGGDGELLKDDWRRAVTEDGSLRIGNVSQSDAGRYTCVARNVFGTSSSSGWLVVKEPTRIAVPPLALDATVGQSVVLPCGAVSDATLEPAFKWFLNGKALEPGPRRDHFEMIGGASAGDLMVRNVQLKHSGKYVCVVRTAVDSVSAAADLIVRGPPGAPVDLVVSKITSSGVELSWGSGPDNHSPVSSYTVQARTPYSIGWQTAHTAPEGVSGQMSRAAVTGLRPWVEHEFRVVAINGVGVGEPSVPSRSVRTEAAVPDVAPGNVSGGGGSGGELVISWEPVPEEQQGGPDLGYTVAFRALGAGAWTQAALASPDAARYVYRSGSLPPLARYEVKVGVHNAVGEGPFSPAVTVFSAEDEPSEAPSRVWATGVSSSQVQVFWDQVSPGPGSGSITAYEVLCWEGGGEQSAARRLRVSPGPPVPPGPMGALVSGLRPGTRYLVSVRALNSAGPGPPSPTCQVSTKKPPPSQAPGGIEWNLTDSRIFLNWERVKALENESEVTGYKVVYRESWRGAAHVLETNQTSVVLRVAPRGETDHLVLVQVLTDAGVGGSSDPIRIPKMSGLNSKGSGEPNSRWICCFVLLIPWLMTY